MYPPLNSYGDVCGTCGEDIGTNLFCDTCRDFGRKEERAIMREMKEGMRQNARRRQRESSA
jgi:hypothetical protein